MFSQALFFVPFLALILQAFSQAPPIEGSWTLINIETSGPLANPGTCATCFPEPPNNTVTFTIMETDTTCTTTWLSPNKPIDYVFCGKTDSLGSEFSFKFPVGEATSFGAFTPIIQFTWIFSVGPVGAGITETIEFQGEKFIDDLTCIQGPPGEDIQCVGGPVSIEIGS